ncbi:MAG: FKBP-type peptidyl-prolyl cis-trans isomerase [Tannerellaceae bacterium]|jgi:peptidylprolyl isomerase/FKBP-type peptidyl-prolyl cis-trans isomerase FklB|nr:FKBP-type peptidyl-prolyl cis-trans isomerase [Tannerellaceae bacterium]
MKKYVYLWTMMCFAVAFFSCGSDSDDNEEVDEAWKLQNEQAFADKAFDAAFTRYLSLSSSGALYYKQITPGNGKRIYYNSRAEVYYEGSFIDGTVFDKRDAAEYQIPFKVAISAAVSNYNATSATGYTSGVIQGWIEILQFMTEGEEGEVWIPQEMAYGTTWDYAKTIPPYSTLIFKIKISKVIWIDEI